MGVHGGHATAFKICAGTFDVMIIKKGWVDHVCKKSAATTGSGLRGLLQTIYVPVRLWQTCRANILQSGLVEDD